MDKNAIKKYAIWARRELISRVSQKALQYGISEKETVDADADSVNGKLLTETEKKQRKALISQIKEKGFKQVMEEVAYTWFNRFSALRFMEVNGYLPTHVRVFTDEDNNFKPQIITEAIHLEMDGLNMDKVYEYKEANQTEELYKYLLITQCNALNKILPGMFQRIADYTELLFPDNLLREGSVIEQMIAMIPEEDWKDAVQIIGWLYQYYNSEPKDQVFANLKKNIKISKENIPAATQLFTPDWIVRYMVENSLGRLWLEGHPNEKLKAEWKYYLDEAAQEAEVKAQLDKIREEYKVIKPEEIRCVDPCMGSGHILVYMFDVLMQIYESYGYNQREAAKSIIENNLYGLDIDERAAQLAYFAVMMKARQYDRRFFSRAVQPHVYAIRESNHLDKACVEYFVNGDAKLKADMDTLISELHDAKEYGSILNVSQVDFDALYARFDEIKDEINIARETVLNELLPFVQVAQAMAKNYDVVVTNPPYMGNMPVKMTDYVKSHYEDSKYDLYSVFIEKCVSMTIKNGFTSLITQHTWMFISSFERFRRNLMLNNFALILHLGTRAFDAIGGEVVQTSAIVMAKRNIRDYRVKANRLVEYTDAQEKENAYLNGCGIHTTFQKNFELLPGNPIVYWLSDDYFNAFKNGKKIEEYVERKAGVVTGNDNYFLRLWFEVKHQDISFMAKQSSEYGKYHIMSKGGSHRRYYGNYEYVIRLRDLWDSSKTNASVRRGDSDYYFKKAIGWSQVGNAQKSFRYVNNSVCGTATPTIYLKNEQYFDYILAFLNTKIAYEYLTAYNPTINLLTTDICNLPLIISNSNFAQVDELCNNNIDISKNDWDSFETSWDFKRHPLLDFMVEDEREVPVIRANAQGEYMDTGTEVYLSIENAYENWKRTCDNRFNQLKANEEELNRIYIDIYGLQNELTPEVEDKDITVHRIYDSKEDVPESIKGSNYVLTKQDVIKSLISYAVGCMFGRYSLDVDGLAYAGGDWDNSKYKTFPADKDNIIPICEDEYFPDDIVARFVKFIETVYGADTLEENLKFIADALGGKGTSREVIRNYFLNDFYADHCKTYQKRPIYWLFDSGKKNGFKALIYMHRYQPDILARMRTDYVHEQQARYRTAIENLQQRINGASTAERVKLNKQLTKLQEQAQELRVYEEKIHHLADQMIRIDLDDGVKHNYEIFKDVLANIK